MFMHSIVSIQLLEGTRVFELDKYVFHFLSAKFDCFYSPTQINCVELIFANNVVIIFHVVQWVPIALCHKIRQDLILLREVNIQSGNKFEQIYLCAVRTQRCLTALQRTSLKQPLGMTSIFVFNSVLK